MRLTPTQQQIYDLVRRRPRTADEIISALWWVHPQDAPKRSCIKAHVWHLNQRLKAHGERVCGDWGGGPRREALYRWSRV